MTPHVHVIKIECSECSLNVSMKRNITRPIQAQALVEYALILTLVAVAVIVAAFAIGLATQRIYGVVTAALGGSHNASGAAGTIVIDQALCVVTPTATGLYIIGTTNIPLGELTGSTESAVGTGINGLAYALDDNGGTVGGFRWAPLIGTSADTRLCPKAVVIQSSQGAIAVAPIKIVP